MNQQFALSHIIILRELNTDHLGIISTCKMAAVVQSADRSEQVITSQKKENVHDVFIPKDTLDQPCDVVLMVKDGKEFKAHSRVLS